MESTHEVIRRQLETEADTIENAAALLAYRAGLGASEWESFLTPPQTHRLIELAEQGAGTWAKEPENLERIKQLHEANRVQKFREWMSTKDCIKSQLDAGAALVAIHGHNGRMELTPEQARKVLAGGELVVVGGKVVVK